MTISPLRNKTAIAGVGSSDFGKLYRSSDPERNGVTLGIKALKMAVEDAGLKLSDIDGLISSGVTENTAHYQKFAYRAGLRDVPYLIPYIQSGRMCGAIIAHAAMAIDAGLANCVACVYSTMSRSTQNRYDRGFDLYDSAFGMASPGAQYAMMFSRYLDQYGYRGKEHLLAAVPIAFRKHAGLNPFATMRDPITLEDYMRAPYVARPLRRLDYCLISDGSVCIIMTSAERARTLKKPPVYLSAFAHHGTLWEPYVPPQEPQARYFSYAERMMGEILQRSGMSRKDISSFQVYDNFTPDVLWTLEGAGFCKPGQALDWVQGGRIELGGELPMNTSGGMMSETYLQGWNSLAEAARQLRHECGERQVKDCNNILYACLAGVSNMLLLSRQ